MPTSDDIQTESFFYIATPALIAGATQAVLFNPFDRALYVRVKFRRRFFLDRRNFQKPFQGFMNAAVYRTLLGGSYMFFQDYSRIFIERYLPDSIHASQSPQLNAFLVGAIAGTLNGAVLNSMQVVKYRMWSIDRNVTFFRLFWDMYRESGPRIFLRGTGATALRDCVFGIVYETTRRATAFTEFLDGRLCAAGRRAREWSGAPQAEPGEPRRRDKFAFVSNLIAALLASVLSSPFNYVRSVIYGAPSGSVPMRSGHLLRAFVLQARFIYRHGESFTDVRAVKGADAHAGRPHEGNKKHYGKEWRVARIVQCAREAGAARAARRGRYPLAMWRWMNSRLNIGWGSARVGLGMAIGQSIFHLMQNLFLGYAGERVRQG